MNKHFTQNILGFFLLIVIALSSGCGQSTVADSLTSNPQTTQTLNIPPILPPTVRVPKQVNDCNSPSDAGRIFFFRGNSTGKRNHASYYDLYVMDGNGCFARLVMPEVSGSPAWSADSKRLAVGCENNIFLCILDITATLDTCASPAYMIGECRTVVLQKFALPPAIGGDERMYNISWTSDGTQIAVEGGSELTHHYFVYALTLSDQGTWKLFIQGLSQFNLAWSPKEEQLALSGLSFINLQTTNVAPAGMYPEWSPNGKRITYIRSSNDDSKEPYGIACVNIDSGDIEWLYEPQLRDKNNYPPHDLVIRDNGQYHRLLSWSPDERYIAFVSEVGFGAQSHIFRLNIETGEVVNLTANLQPQQGAQAYYAPAWGPQ